VGARGDGVVRAGARTEEAHRHEDQRADDHAEQRRGDRLTQRQAENHRKGAEDDGGERVRPAELDAEQVEGPRRPLGVRDRVDAVLLDLGRPGAPGIRRQSRELGSAHVHLRVRRWRPATAVRRG
jgi:hypothetical protein